MEVFHLNAEFFLLPSNCYLPKFFWRFETGPQSKFKDFPGMKENFKDFQGLNRTLKSNGFQDVYMKPCIRQLNFC